ncbi:MAG: D-alanyl-D-alanine carboxypeptidase/D-alanyl-D-alanine-endopeptidase [Rickettsiales bacterium]|nr:D-alanyl-D-alanine carboxypeptidase/D-alanyl-D-alanine-endopeptidase [Rickettsiales bacterium]
MVQFLRLFLIILILTFTHIHCIAHQATKKTKDNDSALYFRIKKLLKKYSKTDLNIGIYIKDLSDGAVKFYYHPERFFKPASIVKMFTAYEALYYLGSEYKFNTSMFSRKAVTSKGILNANLYVKFSGDPSLTYENLKQMFKDISVKKITGDIVIDGTIFDKPHAAPGGFTWDDRPFYYAAPSSAIIINKNCSEAKIYPASIVGKKANLFIEDPRLLKIKNNVITVRPKKNECLFKSKYIGDNQYEVYGCMFNNMKKNVRLNFALQDNNLMASNYIDKILNELHIKLKGKIKFGRSPRKLQLLHTHQSPPLKELLKETMQKSCNISASSIFKHIAAKYTKQQANDELAEEVMRSLFKKAGFKEFFIIKDGAGASRYNLVSPKLVVELLNLVYKNSKIKKPFISSLARYGTEGTLKTRTAGKKIDQHIYGKTGNLKGNSAFAGYYLPPNGKKYAFAIFISNHVMSWKTVKSLEDKILNIILN